MTSRVKHIGDCAELSVSGFFVCAIRSYDGLWHSSLYFERHGALIGRASGGTADAAVASALHELHLLRRRIDEAFAEAQRDCELRALAERAVL